MLRHRFESGNTPCSIYYDQSDGGGGRQPQENRRIDLPDDSVDQFISELDLLTHDDKLIKELRMRHLRPCLLPVQLSWRSHPSDGFMQYISTYQWQIVLSSDEPKGSGLDNSQVPQDATITVNAKDITEPNESNLIPKKVMPRLLNWGGRYYELNVSYGRRCYCGVGVLNEASDSILMANRGENWSSRWPEPEYRKGDMVIFGPRDFAGHKVDTSIYMPLVIPVDGIPSSALIQAKLPSDFADRFFKVPSLRVQE
jgi:hypothetical protein